MVGYGRTKRKAAQRLDWMETPPGVPINVALISVTSRQKKISMQVLKPGSGYFVTFTLLARFEQAGRAMLFAATFGLLAGCSRGYILPPFLCSRDDNANQYESSSRSTPLDLGQNIEFSGCGQVRGLGVGSAGIHPPPPGVFWISRGRGAANS